MKIQVTEIFSDEGTLRVSFNSPFGKGTASWRDTTVNIGETLDAELEPNEIFSWGHNILPSSTAEAEITVANGFYKIGGELIQDTNQRCAALKFGDSIILTELDKLITHESSFVELRATDILLYPTNI